MRAWQLFSTRNPLWRASGLAAILVIGGLTATYLMRGPRPLKAEASGGQGRAEGRYGTFVEQLGEGRFALSYDTIQGTQEEIHLSNVSGRLEEPQALWGMVSPSAKRVKGAWTLMGPMDVTSQDPGGQVLTGRGRMPGTAPALQWDKGVWTGLSTLLWDDLAGNGKGRWTLPPGWHRGLDGLFRVDKGPVHWQAAEEGALRTLTADRMLATLGFKEGTLQDVQAELDGGSVQARMVDIQAVDVLFHAPITFQRQDGWRGSAESGRAPRPPEGKPFDQLDLKGFQASRSVAGGQESVKSLGARWTPAGLRLEGDVRLEQPADGLTAILRAPRVLQRTGPGPDLPEDLKAGETWAEPQAVLVWGDRSLSSPRIEARHAERTWRIQAPALGKGELGTFSAGEGTGNPARWMFKGPILARFLDGGQARGDGLLWEGSVMTLTGRPATWTRLRQRLAGQRVIRAGESVVFPQGITGALAAQEGDITLQADRGEGRGQTLDLDGRVQCQGQAWRLQAGHISVTLGPGNVVKQMVANGSVVLRGRMGEGRGDTLLLDPAAQTATWQGDVKALTEVKP